MIVQKFGGTSVGTPERLKTIARITSQREPLVVVLSAFSGTTNTLVEIVELWRSGKNKSALEKVAALRYHYNSYIEELFSEKKWKKEGQQFIHEVFDKLEQDLEGDTSTDSGILSLGELLSTRIFYFYLKEAGRKVAYLTAFDFMRKGSDDEPDTEWLAEILPQKIKQSNGASLFVTQGYICRNSDGEIDNLGRGGSDYSATLIGASINASEIQIWTDIDGIQNNDPRYVNNTLPVRKISFDEAAELAYFGAKILHPQCIAPAKLKNIPVLLKNTLDAGDEGTLITSAEPGAGFKAVAAKDNITVIRIKSGRMLLAYGFIRKVFEVFEKYKTPVDMITTSEVAVSATIDCTDHLDGIVEELKNYGTVTVESGNTIIAVVGEILSRDAGYANRLFASLREIPVSMISYGASSHNISILVKESDKLKTLQAIQNGIF